MTPKLSLRVALFLAFAPVFAQAQNPVDRAMLVKWDDSLAAASSLDQLARLSPKSSIKSEANSFRNTLYRLRQAELSGNLGEMERAIGGLLFDLSGHGKWPWPEFAMARALIVLHRVDIPPDGWSGVITGESFASAAFRHLDEMMRKDPLFEPGREFFFETLVAMGERELQDEQIAPLKRELARPFPDGRALLVWGRSLRSQGLWDSAGKVFTRAVLAGEDVSRLAIERAKVFQGRNDAAAARTTYWEGLERLTPKGRAAYRYDLSWIVGEDSLKSFDALPVDSVGAWIHRFWDERDATAANLPGERLQEHLERWITVIKRYRVATPWRKTDQRRTTYGFDGIHDCIDSDSTFYLDLWKLQPAYPGDIRDRERLLDQRGLIYLRHGKPLKVMGTGNYDVLTSSFQQANEAARVPTGTGRGGPPPPRVNEEMRQNVSWLYWIGGNWRMLHFRGSAAFGMNAPTTLSSYLPFNAARPEWYMDVETATIPEYQAAADLLYHFNTAGARPNTPLSCERAIQAAVVRARDDGHVSITSDSDTPSITSPWQGAIGIYALGHADEKNGKALITFALPASQLKDSPDELSRKVWPVHFRFVAYDPKSGQQRVIDTVRVYDAKPTSARDEFVSGVFELPLGAGEWQVAMRFDQRVDSVGMYALLKPVIVNHDQTLALSDIVLGSREGMRWTAPDGQPFLVNTLGAWKQGIDLDTYFEVRGVAASASYSTSIQVIENKPGGKTLYDITSNDVSSGSFTPVRKSLNLDKLEPGAYFLKVVLTANGRSVERRSGFNVVKP